MNKKRPLFTILTATHNRYRFLRQLYKSLKNQSYKKIEWIVGNDGSTDKTDEFIRSKLNKNEIKIKYIKSNIRVGKTIIDNILLSHVSGKYICYCGSDDYFKKNAFEIMFKLLDKQTNKNNINGVITQSVDTEGLSQTFYENKIPNKKLIMSWEQYSKFIKGDSTNLEKASVYKNKKFKEVDFLISESTLINKVHKNKLFIVSPAITKIMRRANDSISFGSSLKYCRGYAFSVAINLDREKFSNLNFKYKIWNFINYWRYVWHGDIKLNKAKKMWVITKKLNLYYLLIPLSIILCIRDIFWKKIEKTHLQFEKNKKKMKIQYFKN